MRKPVRIRNVFHHIRHGFAVPPSPQGEGFFLRIFTDVPRVRPERPYEQPMKASAEAFCGKTAEKGKLAKKKMKW